MIRRAANDSITHDVSQYSRKLPPTIMFEKNVLQTMAIHCPVHSLTSTRSISFDVAVPCDRLAQEIRNFAQSAKQPYLTSVFT